MLYIFKKYNNFCEIIFLSDYHNYYLSLLPGYVYKLHLVLKYIYDIVNYVTIYLNY